MAVAQLSGTIQNDVLKEYVARGTYIYPVEASMRLITDTFAYAAAELPSWNTISISGYHIREAGSTAAQEVAFTIANGLAYVEAARAAGLDVDAFAPRLSFFWNAHNGLFEEAAKYRAARRMWARLMRDRIGAKEAASLRMRFHTQTAGSSLTAQQPLNNVVRTAYQALSAVLGGTQSLHTNSYDEALGLPTEESATLALRTQQILAAETGVVGAVDPLAGSYHVEAMTDAIEREAMGLLAAIDDVGGAVKAIAAGHQQAAIETAAYEAALAVDAGEATVVGVNAHEIDADDPVPVLRVDPRLEKMQLRRLESHLRGRDAGVVESALAKITDAAASTDNVLHPMKVALRAGATVGEVSDALRSVFGTYVPPSR